MLQDLKKNAPSNVAFAGFVGEGGKQWLFEHAAALIISSRVPETASLVVLESHAYGIPVVYPRGGGAEESVKWLKRSGCALDEFTGQALPRSSKTSQDYQGDFDRGLTDLLRSSAP